MVSYHRLGISTDLKLVITAEEDTNKIPKTRAIRISEPLYRRFVEFLKCIRMLRHMRRF